MPILCMYGECKKISDGLEEHLHHMAEADHPDHGEAYIPTAEAKRIQAERTQSVANAGP